MDVQSFLFRNRLVRSTYQEARQLNDRLRGRSSLAPVAQLDRVLGFEPRGRAFESLRARH